MIAYRCPHCGKPKDVSDAFVGETITCERCGATGEVKRADERITAVPSVRPVEREREEVEELTPIEHYEQGFKARRSRRMEVLAICLGVPFGIMVLICGVAGIGKLASSSKRKPTPDYSFRSNDRERYLVEVKFRNGIYLCDVTFIQPIPNPATIDRIVWDQLERLSAQQPDDDALAMAFVGDDALNHPRQYSGPMVYKAKKKRIYSLEDSARND